MACKPKLEPDRREFFAGLAILIVLGSVALSRSGIPTSSFAAHQQPMFEPAVAASNSTSDLACTPTVSTDRRDDAGAAQFAVDPKQK